MALKENQAAPRGYQQLTVSTVVATPSIPLGGVSLAMIRNEGSSDVRYRDDNVAPTSATGFLLKSGDVLEYNGVVEKLVFICAGAGSSAVLDIAFYA